MQICILHPGPWTSKKGVVTGYGLALGGVVSKSKCQHSVTIQWGSFMYGKTMVPGRGRVLNTLLRYSIENQ